MSIRSAAWLLLFTGSLSWSAQKRSMTIEDLWAFQYIDECALSPNGEWIAFSATSCRNDNPNRDIFLMTSRGGSARQLTVHQGYDGSPRWSPDGSLLAFISDRTGTRQIHVLPMDGGEAHPISHAENGIIDFLWSPNGGYFAFTSLVNRTEEDEQDSTSAFFSNPYLFSRLPFYQANGWDRRQCRHLFVMPFSGGNAWDLTPGNHDTPSRHLGSPHDFAFSPDGQEIAFVRNIDSTQALSTNNDIYVVSSRGGTFKRISLNLGNDNEPVYSPDGRYLAYRATRRPGHRSDQYDLMLFDRQSERLRNLTAGFDLDVSEIVWAPSGDFVYFSALDQGRIVIFSVDIKTDKIKGLLHSGYNSGLSVSQEGDRLYFIRSRMNMPSEIFTCNDKGDDLEQLSFLNHAMLNKIEMNGAQNFWFNSFDGKLVHGFLIKPSFFDPARKYPMVLLIHSGPHTSWQDRFQKSWNAQMFASQGYVVLMINCRGSKGYGQSFCDAVTKNWGSIPYRDLMQGVDYAVQEYPFIDSERIAAAGAFFGGYMVNWIAGHTQRFQCLVSHAGLSDLASFYGSTSELWFPEWEFEGNPYTNAKQYDRWTPLNSADHFKTPTLVTHGALDHRSPVNQGIQMFTALQRFRVPSRLLCFPDEGHEIEKTVNARLWWKTVLDWMALYTQKDNP